MSFERVFVLMKANFNVLERHHKGIFLNKIAIELI